MKYISAPFVTDFYKIGHPEQIEEGTSLIFSNYTPRSGKHMPITDFDGKAVWFGLQEFIKTHLIEDWNETFFNVPFSEIKEQHTRFIESAIGVAPLDKLHALHKLGYLPIQIQALPEGSLVPMRVPFVTVFNTHPDFAWVSQRIETVMSDELWKQITVATITYSMRKKVNEYAEKTGSPEIMTQWLLHDFSMRGMSGRHDAAKCGAGHLLSSKGTDTIPAIAYLWKYYGADPTKELVGGSIPATEHMVQCIGTQAGEYDTYKRLITQIYPSGNVSIVSDTWDYFNVLTNILPSLKTEIMNRGVDQFGMSKVVVRPDSGDPVKILTGSIDWVVGTEYDLTTQKQKVEKNLILRASMSGKKEEQVFRHLGTDDFYKISVEITAPFSRTTTITDHGKIELTAEEKGTAQVLWEQFGGTVNAKGFRAICSRVGMIYGDSITYDVLCHIMQRFVDTGYETTSSVFGIGSYSYQYLTRDSLGIAFKATLACVNGEYRELQKDPKTDSGTKKSAKGLLQVKKVDGEFVLVEQVDPSQLGVDSELKTVFKDSKLVKETSYKEIIDRLWQ